MKKQVIKNITLTAVFAALVFVFTFSLKIPMPGGYVHLGDTMIYLAACLMPFPFSAISAALGGALADLLGGYTVYALPTAIIKAALTLVFTAKKEKMVCARNIIALLPAALITVVGYYITAAFVVAVSSAGETSMFDAQVWIAALSTIVENIGQAGACSVAFIIIGYALDRFGFKSKLSAL